jgi:hypothetical protein
LTASRRLPTFRPRTTSAGIAGPRRAATGATIDGIDVATDHWIGGRRLGSSDAFEDVSPIDERTIAESR